jgi:thiol-disulfide isomerase/thioredoxin
MAELVDALDLKSNEHCVRAGSIPAPGTSPADAGLFLCDPQNHCPDSTILAIFTPTCSKLLLMKFRHLIPVLSFLLIGQTSFSQTKGYDITYTLHGLQDTMAWLCQVYGNEVYAIDSCVIRDQTARFEQSQEESPSGVYKIVFNDTLFTDIILSGEKVVLESRLPDIIGSMKVMASEENRLLFGYWQFYFRIQDTLDEVIRQGRELYYASQGKPSKALDALEKRADQLEKQKIDYIIRMKYEYPAQFAPKLVWSFQKPDYRFYLMHGGRPYASEKEYYQNHFLDRLDMSDARMLYTEVLFVMINDYMKTFAQPPSTGIYIELAEEVLKRAKGNNEVYQYCIELFIRNFEAGVWEKVFIHLVENHYLESPLSNPALKKVYAARVRAIRNTSVGEKVPEVCGTTPSGEKKCLTKELGTRTLLLFWSFGCDHCEAILPGLVKIQNEYQEKGLRIFAFTLADNRDSLQAAIDRFGINWINVSDYREFLSEVVDEFNISVTPVMYLLDANGVITDKPTSIPVLYSNLVVRFRDQ